MRKYKHSDKYRHRVAEWSICGLELKVVFGSGLEDPRRGDDLWLGRLQDRIPALGPQGR